MKGASSLIVVLIILVVSLLAVTWFRSNVTSGTSMQDELIDESEIEAFNHRFENAKLYLENSLMYSGEMGSDVAANFSGRKAKEEAARYWLCRDTPQVPSKDVSREALTNFTKDFYEDRIEEIHGIRDNLVYQVGEMTCLDSGYKTPVKSRDNDKFRQGVNIESFNLSREDGELKRNTGDLTMTQEVKYNRYWYLYGVLKKWVQEEDLKNSIRSELAEVKDTGSRINSMCITDGSKCSYPSPKMCTSHDSWLDQAVVEGMSDELDRLEEAEEYFNSTSVECSFAPNRKNGNRYPGHFVTVEEDKTPKKQSTQCGCAQYNSTTPPNHCIEPKWDYNCENAWHLTFESSIDFTISCRDRKFNSIPNRSLGNLNWKIDLSYKVTDSSSNGGYSCSQPPYGVPPTSLRSCSYSSSATTCSTGVETIE